MKGLAEKPVLSFTLCRCEGDNPKPSPILEMAHGTGVLRKRMCNMDLLLFLL
jgi:hypothetical protein